jgi:hypothetical protein
LGAALWLTVSEVLVGLSIYLLLGEVCGLHPSPVRFGIALVGASAFWSVLWTLWNGQITIVLLAMLTIFLVLEKRGRPFLAGLALACVALKPNPFLLLAPLMGLWLVARHRWRVVLGGAVGLSALMGVSWLVQPGWLFEWMEVRGKLEVTIITPTIWGVAYKLSPALWPLLGLLAAALLSGGIGWLVLSQRDLDAPGAISLTLSGSLLITPYAWAYEHALLLLPLALIFARIKSRALAYVVWPVSVLVLPWLLNGLARKLDWDVVFVALPLLVGTAFYIVVCYPRRLGCYDRAV